MSAPPRSEPYGMQPLDVLGEGTTTAISQSIAISWETADLWQELMRIAADSSDMGAEPGTDPDDWLGTADKRSGTWWQEWADWVIGHSGSQRPAPGQPGSAMYPPLDPAPGRYVTDGGPR
jgi:hypothetical protein